MLTKQLKQDWLNALESGKYTQGTGQLKENDRHCCLGVLAEVAGYGISTDGERCAGIGRKENGYAPFEELMSKQDIANLWNNNDNSFTSERDYSNVIPLIRELPTSD